MEIVVNDFILKDTFDCGQCFRWDEQDGGSYVGVANGCAVRVTKTARGIEVSGGDEEYWKKYFDTERDYGAIKKALVASCAALGDAVEFGGGIHILKQDFFEALISFIISQQNAIPKIKKAVNALCEKCGDAIGFEGKTYYAFPSPDRVAALSEDDLRALSLGYRAKYVLAAAQEVASGKLCEAELEKMSTAEARKRLLALYGVGDKVCDCVLLFSLGKFDLFPSDVWIKRVMAESFDTNRAKITGEEMFGEYSGFAQQYLFYWRRSMGRK